MKEADLQALAQIYVDVYTDFDVGEKWTVPTAKDLLEYWLKRQADLAFVAELDGELVGGFVAGVKPWWDGMHLVDGEVFVHPKHQKSGVGTELSKVMYKTALDKYNVVAFDTYTFSKTDFPLKWYKKQGFKEIKEWTMISADVKEVLDYLEKD